MSTSDRFLLAGVMGWPVGHSRSPMIHNHLMAKHGLSGTYIPLAIRPEQLNGALRGLAPLGFAGCNITIPHKQQALAIADDVDDVARRIGAVSCIIVRPDGSLAGTNNDCFGFVENMLHWQPDWRADAGPAVVIGAGGGARAVVYGHLHIPRTTWYDGVRFEEVSLGYPREWRARGGPGRPRPIL